MSEGSDEILDYKLRQDSIDYEYELNNERLNALLLFNAILFAGLGISGRQDGSLGDAISMLILIVPLLGLFTAIISAIAIHAGIGQIIALKRERTQAACEMGRRVVGANVGTLPHILGLLPARIFPWLLAVVWFLLMCSSRSEYLDLLKQVRLSLS